MSPWLHGALPIQIGSVLLKWLLGRALHAALQDSSPVLWNQSGRRLTSKDMHSGTGVRVQALMMISTLSLGSFFLFLSFFFLRHTHVHSLPFFPPIFSPLFTVGSVSAGIISSLLLAPFRWLIMSTANTHTDLLIKCGQSATSFVFSSEHASSFFVIWTGCDFPNL